MYTHTRNDSFVVVRLSNSFNIGLFLLTQIVTDSNQEILYIDPTVPGSQNDQFVYDQSNLRVAVDGGHLGNYFIMADSG